MATESGMEATLASGGDEGSWLDEPLTTVEDKIFEFTEFLRSEDDRADIMSSFIDDDIPLFHLLALFSAAMGVKSRGEIFLAGGAHIIWWFLGYTGVEGMYSVLVGSLIAKKQYTFAAFPAILDVYTGVQKARKSKSILASIKGETIAKFALAALGFVLAYLKYV